MRWEHMRPPTGDWPQRRPPFLSTNQIGCAERGRNLNPEGGMPHSKALRVGVGMWLGLQSTAAAQAQEGNASNAANSPLTPSITFNFQDYYVPDIVGLPDREANQYLQRGLLPYKLFDTQQLFR